MFAVSGAVYAQMQDLGMTWGVLLRAMAFYGAPGILLMVRYEVLQRRGVTKGQFFKRGVFDVLWGLVLGFFGGLVALQSALE
ncbi:hypothetical protein [Bartonella massiliensis]|uniref:hypothetical protein n=1 Tax=Bartonella massiliensis TaxID=929795 RepID=UPI001FEA4B60|nr:hypothetical protein [Bartonella massiliensis]